MRRPVSMRNPSEMDVGVITPSPFPPRRKTSGPVSQLALCLVLIMIFIYIYALQQEEVINYQVEETTGVRRHQPTRLVVQIGEDYMFWRGPKVCDLIKNLTETKRFGNPVLNSLKSHPTPLLNFTMECSKLGEHTGNWITAIYMMRLAAAMGRIDLQFQCTEGMRDMQTDLLPWFMGYYPAPAGGEWPYDFGEPPDSACYSKFHNIPLYHLAHVIQHDMRRIAVTMMGTRGFDITTTIGSGMSILTMERESQQPIFADRELDDVAIHFRCGDVFGGTRKSWYGLIPFGEYARIIPNSTRSIGIHTQPFDVERLRLVDRPPVEKCRKVVRLLETYLGSKYPATVIFIRNTANDTLPLTYSRMIMACQTIVSMSTFGIFPAIGSFGESYFQKSTKQNRYAQNISAIFPNMHAMTAPMLSSPAIKKSKWEKVIKFLLQGSDE